MKIETRTVFLLPMPWLHLAELNGVNGWWEATDTDCSFKLLPNSGKLPTGWTRLTVPLQTPRETYALPVLWVDTGAGYHQLPVILPKRSAGGHWTFMIHVPTDAIRMAINPATGLGPLRLGQIKAKPISRLTLAARCSLSFGMRWLHDPSAMLQAGRNVARLWRADGMPGLRAAASSALLMKEARANAISTIDRYARWITENEDAYEANLPYAGCRFSVLIPVGKNETKQLAVTLAALKAQSSATWNCLIGAAPDVIMPKQTRDKRVSCLRLSTAERGAMLAELAKAADGDMLLVLDPGDRLALGALAALAPGPDAAIVYGDEDRIASNGHRCAPFLKPEWSPDLLTAFNYFGRPTALRRSWVERVGGFNSATGAAAEWDLHLRLTTATGAATRVPRMLCHRRADSDQDRPRPRQPAAAQDKTADYRAAITNHWKRLGTSVTVTTQPDGTQRTVRAVANPPLVSIILANFAEVASLVACLQGIEEATDYPRIQVIVVDDGSADTGTSALLARLVAQQRIELASVSDDTGAAAARNAGARIARGDLLLFMDNDIRITTPDWLMELVQFALRPGVGVVGPLLVDHDGMVRHTSVIIGMQLYGPLFRGAPETQWGPIGSANVPRTCSAVAGACQLVRREVLAQVGGFDETYTTNICGIALCLAARGAGWRIAYTPFARLIQSDSVDQNRPVAAEETMRIASAIRRFGYEHDPFFHPALDAGSTIPRLRISGEPDNAASLRNALHPLRASWERSAPLDLGNDADVAAAAGTPVKAVTWPPQSPDRIDDKWSAARWCIDLLRRRPDLRQQYPDALSSCAGAFARWLGTEAVALFGLTTEASKHIQAALAGDIAAPARQAVLTEGKLIGPMAVAFLPIGRAALLRFLLQRESAEPRLEEIWWLALTCAEGPARELVFSYRFNPDWQALFQDGLTVFGRDRFAAWFQAAYQCDAEWTKPANWSVSLSRAEQIRIGWNAHRSWQQHHPDPFASPDHARALIDWLASPSAGPPHAGLPPSVQGWLANLPAAAVAKVLAVPGVNVFAHFCYPSGLRTSALSVVQGLQASGYDVTLRDVAVDLQHDLPNHAGFDGLEIHDTTLLHIQPEPLFLEAFSRANLHPRQRRTYRIGYWYWELETVPKSWSAAVADVNEVWVATRFVGDAIRSSFDLPVFDLMPGVELPSFTKRAPAAFGIPPDRFTFLFVFHMMSVMERKNPLGLIRAFGMAFPATEPTTLILKTSFGDKHPAFIRQLHEAASRSGGKVMIIDEVFTSDETISLMDACDVYISLHRSEGLGLTMAEAMLLGKPVIATGYSGNLAFMSATNSLLVEHRLVAVGHDTPLYDQGAIWAEPSEAHAARLMRQVWENPEQAASLGARGRTDIQTHMSITAAGRRMAERLAAIRARRCAPQTGSDKDLTMAVQLR